MPSLHLVGIGLALATARFLHVRVRGLACVLVLLIASCFFFDGLSVPLGRRSRRRSFSSSFCASRECGSWSCFTQSLSLIRRRWRALLFRPVAVGRWSMFDCKQFSSSVLQTGRRTESSASPTNGVSRGDRRGHWTTTLMCTPTSDHATVVSISVLGAPDNRYSSQFWYHIRPCLSRLHRRLLLGRAVRLPVGVHTHKRVEP